MSFLSEKGIIFEYNSILMNEKLNIIAKINGKKCIGNGFNGFDEKKVLEWFSKNKNLKIYFKNKLSKELIINFIIANFKKNNLNLKRKDINVYLDNNLWNIEIHGIKKKIDSNGKMIDNKFITYNFSKLSSLNYGCNLEKIVLYPERDK